MPRYDYQCKQCDSDFSVYMSMSESRDNLACEKCESRDIYRLYSKIITKTGGFNSVESASSSSSGSQKSGCGTCASSGCATCP
jgi:putative FmdB family regulatory protein